MYKHEPLGQHIDNTEVPDDVILFDEELCAVRLEPSDSHYPDEPLLPHVILFDPLDYKCPA